MRTTFLFFAAQFAFHFVSAQNVGIGTNLPFAAKLQVINSDDPNTNAIHGNNLATGGQRYGVRGDIAGATGAAVMGFSVNGSLSSAGYESNHYGILGITGITGISVGGVTLQGTAIRGNASGVEGIALHTTGRVRLAGIGEAVSKILVSDASGFATWQNLPDHNHFGETWSGTVGHGLTLSNSNAAGSGLRSYGKATGILGESDVATGVGVVGINISAGNYHTFLPNTGVVGVSGTGVGVYAAAVQGTSLLVDKANFGLSTGIVAIIRNSKTGLTTPVLQVTGISNQPVLELNNGFLQVGGTTRTAFRHTTSVANNVANQTILGYPNQAITDLLIVTHSYTPANTYLNEHFGVYWREAEGKWTIYLEDLSAMPVNIVFNVLVIKNP